MACSQIQRLAWLEKFLVFVADFEGELISSKDLMYNAHCFVSPNNNKLRESGKIKQKDKCSLQVEVKDRK